MALYNAIFDYNVTLTYSGALASAPSVERTVVVLAEDRRNSLVGEYREIAIPWESRILSVEQESRSA